MSWDPCTTTENPPGGSSGGVPSSGYQSSQHFMDDASLAKFYSSIAGASSSEDQQRAGRGDDDEDFEEEENRLVATPPKAAVSSPAPPLAGDCDEFEENSQDLLVFGYQCKIFRDDERAQWVEEEKHLIPWMGHPELLVDRYDCRGALMDISRYEPGSSYQEDSPGQLDAAAGENNVALNEEEVLRKELNEERYRDLNEDEDYDERAYQQDTDFKRFQTAMDGMLSETGIQEKTGGTRNYAAFQYNYNEKSHDICIGPEPKRLHDEDAPYVKPAGLYIPEEIALPKTVKNHAIIEKTAKFIASQGNQMEIILKTKQAGNPLFDFLNHSGKLNPYYKFMVHAIRTGIYRPPAEDVQDAASLQDCSGSEEDGDHTYLHPSLFRASNSVTSSMDSVSSYSTTYPSSSIASAPSRHNAYSMLVSKIKGTDSPDPIPQSSYNSGTTVQQHQVPPPPFMSTVHQHQINNHPYNAYGYNVPPVVQPQRPQKQLPSTQDQLIIEKMASYVIKNGSNFEVLAKNKGDPRFGFLNLSHEYHWYYLNCKERFKAESNAVVASSDFVTYDKKSPPAQTTPTTTSSSTTVKKSAAAELAELKRKNMGLSPTKNSKSGGGCNSSSASGRSGSSPVAVPAESVFSQANLVKEKDKPVIRFASSLSLNTLSSSPSTIVATVDMSSHIVSRLTELPKEKHNSKSSPQPCLHSPGCVDSGNEEDSGNGCVSPFDDTGGNTTPASDDEEQARRRLERKRKAALFLQKLKMKNASDSTVAGSILTEKQEVVPRSPPPAPKSTNYATQSSSSHQPKESGGGGLTVTGTSLGDLLSRRLQADNNEQQQQQVTTAQGINLLPLPSAGDNADYSNGIKSSSSSRHSSRSRNRSHNIPSRSRRKSHRSSSSSAPSQYDSTPFSTKKKSSKRKHKRKKKKHEKSSRSSSRKSKRRK